MKLRGIPIYNIQFNYIQKVINTISFGSYPTFKHRDSYSIYRLQNIDNNKKLFQHNYSLSTHSLVLNKHTGIEIKTDR